MDHGTTATMSFSEVCYKTQETAMETTFGYGLIEMWMFCRNPLVGPDTATRLTMLYAACHKGVKLSHPNN
jgi:hypothetical protein